MLRILTSRKGLTSTINKRFTIQQFRLPDLGEKIKEATIKRWRVKEGDLVDEFDTVAEVATDKLFTELPSPYKGKIHRLMYNEEEACNVGDVLLEIDTEDKQGKQSEIAIDAERVDVYVTKKELESDKGYDADNEHKKVLASPAVRALAKELKVRLDDIRPRNGSDKVTKEDIYKYVDNHQNKNKIEQKQQHKEGANKHPEKSDQHVKPDKQKDKKELKKQVSVHNVQTPVKMKLFEQGMVKSMNHAVTVPHFNLHDEYDITELETLRQSLKLQGQSLTLFSFIVKAFSVAIESVPRMNASYFPENDQYECFLNSTHNISIAIDSPQGLAAPNIKHVESLSIAEINNNIKELQKVTSEGKLTAHHLEGGTIALSNIGTITGSFAAPLNLPNQVCIVALGRLTTKPIYSKSSNGFEPRKILPVSFGCDHRVLDGATVARFSVAWKNLLENPGAILTQLR